MGRSSERAVVSKKFYKPCSTCSNAEFVLECLLPVPDCDVIIGDLNERYYTRILPRFGHRRAGMWYAAKTCGVLRSYAWGRIRLILAIAPLRAALNSWLGRLVH